MKICWHCYGRDENRTVSPPLDTHFSIEAKERHALVAGPFSCLPFFVLGEYPANFFVPSQNTTDQLMHAKKLNRVILD